MRDNVRRLERNANPLIRADRQETWRWISPPAFLCFFILVHGHRTTFSRGRNLPVAPTGGTKLIKLLRCYKDNRSFRLKLSLLEQGAGTKRLNCFSRFSVARQRLRSTALVSQSLESPTCPSTTRYDRTRNDRRRGKGKRQRLHGGRWKRRER